VTSTVEVYAAEAHAWLAAAVGRPAADGPPTEDVAVFHSLPHEAERALIADAAAWQRRKFEAGYGAIAWPEEFGGAGLTQEHARVFTRAEASYATPPDHELRRITVNLVAPTLRAKGSRALQERFIRPFLRCDQLTCQLFSEPGAGSDLAGLGTRAQLDGADWIVNGAKVWVSGAQFADWGLLLARTDPDVPKHAGITAFLVPMAADGVGVRPIRQMTGGSSFNEVFFDDLRISDELRIGAVGEGWRVATSMLAFERNQSGSRAGVGGSWEQLLALARRSNVGTDPVLRQRLVRVYVHERLRALTRQRAEEAALRSQTPGPEGSMGKLLWVQGLIAIGDVAATLAGPQLIADTGAAGTYAWAEHVLGAPGFRIAGGSDEIQRNILAERVLGLPGEPNQARSTPWRATARS
jgi:alkylation response protein AidB-like acyl-CoA dehydrogenase